VYSIQPIKLSATIYIWNIVESGVKHHNPNPTILFEKDVLYLRKIGVFALDIVLAIDYTVFYIIF
jgi:hypothetical protein